MIIKSITIREDQGNFIQGERKSFNLSKFVQDKLDEYIKAIKDYRKYME